MSTANHPLSDNEIFNLGCRLQCHAHAAEAAAESADPIVKAFIQAGLHALDLLAVNDAYGDLRIVLDCATEALEAADPKLVEGAA